MNKLDSVRFFISDLWFWHKWKIIIGASVMIVLAVAFLLFFGGSRGAAETDPCSQAQQNLRPYKGLKSNLEAFNLTLQECQEPPTDVLAQALMPARPENLPSVSSPRCDTTALSMLSSIENLDLGTTDSFTAESVDQANQELFTICDASTVSSVFNQEAQILAGMELRSNTSTASPGGD